MKTTHQSAVLVMLDRHLGNFLVASPVLQHLAQQFQSTQLVLHRSHASLARRIPGFPTPLLISNEGQGLWSRAQVFYRVLREIRRNKPDTVIDFGGSKTAALAGGLSRAPLRICHQGAAHSQLYNQHADPAANGPHRIDTYGALAHAAGYGVNWPFPHLKATHEDHRGLTDRHLDGLDKTVCLHVAGGKNYKHWPLDRYAQLIDWLTDQGMRPVLIGAAPDRPAADQVLARCRHRPLDLVEQLPIGTLIALLSQCRLFVGNDSGPMHVAAAAGTRIIALFGPTDFSRWGPLTARAIIVRGTQPVPSGQGKKSYNDGRTMDSIALSAVIDAVRQQLRG